MSCVLVTCVSSEGNYREMRTGNELVGDSVKDGKKTEEAAGDNGLGYIKLEDNDSGKESIFVDFKYQDVPMF